MTNAMDIRVITYLINVPDERACCNVAYLRICDARTNCVSEGTTVDDLKGSAEKERHCIRQWIGYA